MPIICKILKLAVVNINLSNIFELKLLSMQTLLFVFT